MAKGVQDQKEAPSMNGHRNVGTLTSTVNTTEPTPGETAVKALVAAEIYTDRLLDSFEEAVVLLRDGRTDEATDTLSAAISGIHFLADLLAAVDETPGVEALPDTDWALGRVALGLQEIVARQAACDTTGVARSIERDLVPALRRLMATFPTHEARIIETAEI